MARRDGLTSERRGIARSTEAGIFPADGSGILTIFLTCVRACVRARVLYEIQFDGLSE
jgi:hypothetical protein